MHTQLDELLDRVYGHPHSRFGDRLGKRGVRGRIVTQNFWLQSSAQLCKGLFVLILNLWHEVDLLKKVQPTEASPGEKQKPDGEEQYDEAVAYLHYIVEI